MDSGAAIAQCAQGLERHALETEYGHHVAERRKDARMALCRCHPYLLATQQAIGPAPEPFGRAFERLRLHGGAA